MNILYLDREPAVRSAVKDILATAGERLIEAETLEDGIAILENVDVQLLLVDMRVVGLTGLAQLRSRCVPRTVIYALSPTVSPGMRVLCVCFGANGLIHRPVAKDVLVQVLEKIGGTSG
ncbi:response regulator [Sphingomonas sp. PB4P5]|uniref:response regulator n=1 Tax=Parasphingomonas puruogangriensis TaxID=3096155 RepID=UPI002FC79CEB